MKNKVSAFLSNNISFSPGALRLGLTFGMIIYGVFGYLDLYAMPSNYGNAWIIRYAIILPLLIITYLLSYYQVFYRYSKTILILLLSAGQIGIIAMIGISMPDDLAFSTYYAGLILVMLWAGFIFRFSFYKTIYMAFSTVILYNLTDLYKQYLLPIPFRSTDMAILLNNNFFLISSAVLVTIGAYQFERILTENSKFNAELIKEKELLKLAKERVEESESRFKALHNASFGGITIHDKGLILECNQGLSEIFGYQINDLIGMDGLLLLAKESREMVMQNILAEYTKPYEAIGLKKTGEKFPLRIESRKIPYKGQQVRVTEFRDITVEKLAEKKLKDSEEKHRLLFNSATDAIFIHNEEEGILAVNHTACERLGYSNEGLMALAYGAVDTPEFRQYVPQLIARLMEQGHLTYETVQQRKDGSSVPTEINAKVITWDGKPAIMSTCRDITERKQADEAIKESEARFRQMAELLPQIVFETDMMGNLTYVNKQSYKLAGYPDHDSLIGESTLSFFIPNDRTRAVENIKLSIAGKPSALSNGYTMLRKDGSTFPVLVYSNPILKENQPIGLRGIIVDISELKMAENEIIKLNEELEQRVASRTIQLEAANKELEAFSYSVSHDLRTPLRALDGFANILLEDYAPLLDSEGKRMLNIIIANANRMGNLIDDLLAFSHLGRQEMQYTRVDMYEMADSVYHELANNEDAIEFRLYPIPETMGDPALVRQVWLNFIGNAIKFSAKKLNRIIEIGTLTSETEISYFVKDNGAGFNMDYSNKLFAVFQRLHSPKEFEGTGIGLSIVQRIIQRHGGRVWAEGKVDEGATFYFNLGAKSEK